MYRKKRTKIILHIFLLLISASCKYLQGPTFDRNKYQENGLPSNANLSALVLSSGSLNPVFSPSSTNYSVTVDNSITSLTLTPTLSDLNASLKINGTLSSSGSPSPSIPLNEGLNIITLLVTAQNGSTAKTYTITATREVYTGLQTCTGSNPPVLLSSVPESNSFFIDPRQGTLTYIFSETMNTSLVQNLTAIDGNTTKSIPHTVGSNQTEFSWSSTNCLNDTLKVKISWIRFPENTLLKFTLAMANLKDLANRTLTSDIQIQFTTVQISFHSRNGDFLGPTLSDFSYVTADNTSGFTNVLWKTCIEGKSGSDCTSGSGSQFTWYSAVNACSYLNTGTGFSGRKNWRLPTLNEMETIKNPLEGGDPFAYRTFFPNHSSTTLTSTAYTGNTNMAWAIYFFNGNSGSLDKITLGYNVQCVSDDY